MTKKKKNNFKIINITINNFIRSRSEIVLFCFLGCYDFGIEYLKKKKINKK